MLSKIISRGVFSQKKIINLKSIHHRVLCFFSQEQNEEKYSNFSKEYIKNLESKTTEFQNEFGFAEAFKEKRLQGLKQEKSFKNAFNLLYILIATTSIGLDYHIFYLLYASDFHYIDLI